MNSEGLRNPSLSVLLTILGVMAVALAAGLLLLQKQENADSRYAQGGSNAGTPQSQSTPARTYDDFDPVVWAREGAAYPPLYEEEAAPEVNGEAGENAEAVLAREVQPESAPENPPKTTPKVTPETTPKAPELAKPAYLEVQENAYWVQVFSSDNISRAETIRGELVEKGFPASVTAREVDGKTWYRVRLGAYLREDEAEHNAGKLRSQPGFESSWVVQAPVTRKIPVRP